MLDGFYAGILPALVQQLKNWLLLPAGFRPRKRIEIENINSDSAGYCWLVNLSSWALSRTVN
jgi:hypothetical protein